MLQTGLTSDGNTGHSTLKQQELSWLELALSNSMPAHALRESYLPWQLMLHRGQASNGQKLTPLQIMDTQLCSSAFRRGTENGCLPWTCSSSCLQLPFPLRLP